MKKPFLRLFFLGYLPGLIVSIAAPISLYASRPAITIFTHPKSILRTEIVFIGIYLSLSAILYLVTKDHGTAGLIGMFLISGIILTIDIFIEFLLCMIIAWVVFTVLKKKIRYKQLEMSILLASLILLGHYGVVYIDYLVISAKWDMNKSMALPIWTEYRSKNIVNKPDIYYVILDGYGSEIMLDGIHHFDNSAFINELKSRGFIIPEKSRSNYPRTILSLASSLNLQYLDPISEEMQSSKLWWPVTGTILNSETVKYLKANGYGIANAASNWDYTTMADADHIFNPFLVYLNRFEEFQIQQTNLSLLTEVDNFGVSLPTYRNHRKTILSAFEALEETVQLSSPRFTFVHIISPHPPFVFDSDGNEINPDYPFTLSDNKSLLYPVSKYRKGYTDQLQFINKKVLFAIDTILLNSENPPVIIIQGDHGPGVFTDFSSIENTCLFERFSILNAYYLPGFENTKIPDDMSPVNTFRLVFNLYFSTNLDIFPSLQYYSEGESIYQFVDVSNKIHPNCSNISQK